MNRDTADKRAHEDVRKWDAIAKDIFKQLLIDIFRKICKHKLKHKNITRPTDIKGWYLGAKNLTCISLVSGPESFVWHIQHRDI